MNNLREYIKRIVSEEYPDLDLSNSSPITDLVINPGSSMLSPFNSQLYFLWDNLGLSNPEVMDWEELFAIGSNFLVAPQGETHVIGDVELLYEVPTTVEIPEGAEFYTEDGRTYVAVRNYIVTASTMENSTARAPLYSTGSIRVRALEPGSEYVIDPEEIISTNVIPEPINVTNFSAFSDVALSETKTEFVDRIFKSVISRSFGSSKSIETTIKEKFPTVKNVTVKGINDEEMIRDLVVNGLNFFYNFHILDFKGKHRGQASDPFPQSSAYKFLLYIDPLLIDEASGSLIQNLRDVLNQFTPEQFSDEDLGGIEFSNEAYAGIYAFSSHTATVNSRLLLEDDFSDLREDVWTLSDSALFPGQLRDNREIQVEDNRARLGVKFDPDATVETVNLTSGFIKELISLLEQVKQQTVTQSSGVSVPMGEEVI